MRNAAGEHFILASALSHLICPHGFVDVEESPIQSSSERMGMNETQNSHRGRADVDHSQELPSVSVGREAPRPNASTADQRKELRNNREQQAKEQRIPSDGWRRPLLGNMKKT